MKTVSKPTVVILPGFMEPVAEWQWLVEALADACTCVVVDINAFSATLTEPQTEPESNRFSGSNRFIEASAALWEAVERQYSLPEQFSLLGYSMGGRIAWAWAQQMPHRINQLVLESCHPGLLATDAQLERQAADSAWATQFQTEPLSAVLEDWYQQGVFANLDKQARQDRITQRLSLSPTAIAHQLLTFGLGWQPHWDRLPAIPTAYICGALDRKFSAIGQQLAAQNTHIRLYQQDDNGHNVHQESPDLFLALIAPLLTRIS
jgi:2-succinyl-6-hydroxy-2,4-cyclohexadiene-1-carboxylate synthase